MIGAQLRLLAWFVILAILLSGCTPAIRLDEAATDRPIQTSSAPPAAREDAPAPHRPPSPTPTPVPRAFALNLYQEGDFVPQYTFDWCVAASIQIMHNVIDDTGAARGPIAFSRANCGRWPGHGRPTRSTVPTPWVGRRC